MTREIVTEKFAENFDTEYVSCDFPLISVMCAKNDYSYEKSYKMITVIFGLSGTVNSRPRK